MGYDMHTVRKPEGEQEKAAAAQAAFNDAVAARNGHECGTKGYDAAQAKVDEAYEAMYAAETSYFRLNVWGMSHCCDLMDRFGMLTPDEAPRFPHAEEYGLAEWPEDPADYDGDERAGIEATLTGADRRFLAAVQAVADFEPQPITGIPSGKFSSNDGWLVTPGQIEAALAAYRATDEKARSSVEAEVSWWPGWIAYLERAKGLGGFRVH